MKHTKVINDNGEIEKAGCVVMNDQHQLLLVTNANHDTYGLPKGHAERGESPLQVARRETLEETGYEVNIVRPLGDMTYMSAKTGEAIRVHYFLATPGQFHDDRLADEVWQWVGMEHAKELVWPNVRQFLIENGL